MKTQTISVGILNSAQAFNLIISIVVASPRSRGANYSAKSWLTVSKFRRNQIANFEFAIVFRHRTSD